MRERAKNQKPTSPYRFVRSYIDNAVIIAPTTSRYLGCTLANNGPTTNIITIVTTPPGDSTRSGPHFVELRLFEVRPDPDVVRYEHREIRPGLRILADRDGQLHDTARLVCGNRRVGKVQLRLLALGFGLRQACDVTVALRSQRLDLPLRQFERRLRTVDRGLLLMQLRGVLLGILNAARELCLRQILVARRLLLCEHQRRLLLGQLCLVGGDLGLLHIRLRIDGFDVGLRGNHLRVGLVQRCAVSAIVDAGDHLAGGHMPIVGNRDRCDVARNLGAIANWRDACRRRRSSRNGWCNPSRGIPPAASAPSTANQTPPRYRMSAEPALAGFVVSAALTRLTILLRLEGLLPASRRAKPVRLIRSRAIRLAPSANRRGVGLWCLHERLVAPLSTIAL